MTQVTDWSILSWFSFADIFEETPRLVFSFCWCSPVFPRCFCFYLHGFEEGNHLWRTHTANPLTALHHPNNRRNHHPPCFLLLRRLSVGGVRDVWPLICWRRLPSSFVITVSLPHWEVAFLSRLCNSSLPPLRPHLLSEKREDVSAGFLTVVETIRQWIRRSLRQSWHSVLHTAVLQYSAVLQHSATSQYCSTLQIDWFDWVLGYLNIPLNPYAYRSEAHLVMTHSADTQTPPPGPSACLRRNMHVC